MYVLPPAPRIAAAAAADPTPEPAAPAGPVKTRVTASEGYRRALAAHRSALSRTA
ncbi:hypothetical protein J7I98_38135 [Streptomyces sp. ISL-98]|uniref:hypothetical protein n=1 Tax=Streptomyces sp. ISL-98 TaxID=2819192 RepID=UPI001BEAD27A|nr:hypothetical protein [Streptomyces sp. ISL-98]MBT2511515.1 hypothetical protein [Streptomyces sp. ISL-98]